MTRQERIEKLLHELEYEITRGMMEREIDENLSFEFIVPISINIINGVVVCQFRTRPQPFRSVLGTMPRLMVVK